MCINVLYHNNKFQYVMTSCLDLNDIAYSTLCGSVIEFVLKLKTSICHFSIIK